MNIIYTDRSRVIAAQRCRRLRWLSYHEGKDGVGLGLEPAKKSIHLVVGGAVHAGMEVLLRDGQAAIDLAAGETLDAKLANVFDVAGENGKTVARTIEDRAVRAALVALAEDIGTAGVELDAEEAAAVAAAAGAGGIEIDFSGMMAGSAGPVAPVVPAAAPPERMLASADSPIVIEFGGLVPATIEPASVAAGLAEPFTPQPDMGAVTVVPPSEGGGQQSESDYLREELSALVEGMVRAWSRRRWRGVLEQFEVMEVEREGEWKLGEWRTSECMCGHFHFKNETGTQDRCIVPDCDCVKFDGVHEIHFLSRHDALLRDRATDYLYLQSFKTAGSWDRRKELDAQVDMQGLSEAVDVDRRYSKWWQEIHGNGDHQQKLEVWQWGADTTAKTKAIYDYLVRCSSPPTVLGVRYEYLLKGSRKKDTKQGSPTFGRWNQESILIRAYRQTGITSTDDRWAWTYDWFDADGRGGRKSRRLDYRSWQKAPVWKSMPISEWIDRLDRGEIQEGAEAESGEPLDALAEQFVPVVTVYRSADDLRDLLEQIESQEVQIARDVAEVRRAEQEGWAAKRSKLNQLFPQSRSACSYPGICQFRSTPTSPGICFGAPGAENDPMVLERFRARVPNHPRESQQG